MRVTIRLVYEDTSSDAHVISCHVMREVMSRQEFDEVISSKLRKCTCYCLSKLENIYECRSMQVNVK
mgnify:CR=1 FL=1